MKKIEKALRNDIKKSARTDFSKISKRCGIGENLTHSKERKLVLADGREYTSHTRRNGLIISILAVLIIVISLCLIIPNIQGNSNHSSRGYFIIDINPSIEISYDENGIVSEVKPLNEDAEVLLLSLDFSNKHYKEALTTILDSCIELGYISPERTDNAVMTTAVTEDGYKDEYMTNEIKAAFSNEFSSRKILGVVITGVESPELKEEAGKFGIDAQKYALIKEYINVGGEISEEEYGEISIRDLYNGIYEKEKEAKQKQIDELKEKEKNDKLISANAIREKAEKIIEQLSKNLEHLPEWEKEIRASIISQVEDIMSKLDSLETAEELNNELNEIKGIASIYAPHMHFDFEDVDRLINDFIMSNEKLNEATKKPEEKREELLDKFGGIKEGSFDIDINEWQSQFEDMFSSSWFEYKEQWKGNKGNQPNGKDHP